MYRYATYIYYFIIDVTSTLREFLPAKYFSVSQWTSSSQHFYVSSQLNDFRAKKIFIKVRFFIVYITIFVIHYVLNYLSFIMNDDKREILYRYKLLRTERFLLYHQWSRVAWRKKNSIPMFRRNCTCSRKFPKLRWKDLIQIKCVEESMWRRLNAASRSAKKRASQRKALFGNASVADCWPWLQLVTRRGPCVPRKGASSPRLPLSPSLTSSLSRNAHGEKKFRSAINANPNIKGEARKRGRKMARALHFSLPSPDRWSFSWFFKIIFISRNRFFFSFALSWT